MSKTTNAWNNQISYGGNQAITLESGTSALKIGTDSANTAIHIGDSSTGFKNITIGNQSLNSSIILNASSNQGVKINNADTFFSCACSIIGNNKIIAPNASDPTTTFTLGDQTTGPVICLNAGDPNGTISAPQGSLCLNTLGSGINDRLFISDFDNTGTWIAVVTVS